MTERQKQIVDDELYGKVEIVAYPETGAWFGLSEDRLVYAPMLADGTPEMDPGLCEPEWGLIDEDLADHDRAIKRELEEAR